MNNLGRSQSFVSKNEFRNNSNGEVLGERIVAQVLQTAK